MAEDEEKKKGSFGSPRLRTIRSGSRRASPSLARSSREAG